MCECGGCLQECPCGDRCCPYCGCQGIGTPDVDYGPVWVDVIDTPTKPPYGSPERAVYDRCDGCSEPNRCGCERGATCRGDV
jgi:hypothetical protein